MDAHDQETQQQESRATADRRGSKSLSEQQRSKSEGDVTKFLWSMFLLTHFRSPGLSHGEKNLLTCLPLRTFKGKQAM